MKCILRGIFYLSVLSVSLAQIVRAATTNEDSTSESCSVVPAVPNGQIVKLKSGSGPQSLYETLSTGTPLDGTDGLFVRCEKNYEPMGQNVNEEILKCQDGNWKKQPVCLPAKCRTEPPTIYNGEITVIEGHHGGRVTYECVKGFEMVEQGSITCHFGQWIGKSPTCKQTGCIVPPLYLGMVSKGKFIEGQLPLQLSPGTIVNNNEEHTLNCHSPEYPNNVKYSTVKCKDGSWEEYLVCRERFCRYVGEPPKIPNGEHTTFYGKHVVYNCHKGFTRTEYGNITCSIRGWSGVPATCTENNCRVPVIDNGKLIERTANWNSTTLVNYEYSEVKPGEVTQPGKSLYVFCNEGYSFRSIKNYTGPVTCQAGEFRPHPACLPADVVFEDRREEIGLNEEKGTTSTVPRNGECEEIQVDKNVIIYYDHNAVRTRAFFVCKGKDKTLVGASDLTCLPNGEWSGLTPKCVSTDCPTLKPQTGMFISYTNNNQVGSWATFHCYLSKNETHDQKIRCLENGAWSRSLPYCAENGTLIWNPEPIAFARPAYPYPSWKRPTGYSRLPIGSRRPNASIPVGQALDEVPTFPVPTIREKPAVVFENGIGVPEQDLKMRMMETEMKYRMKEHEIKMKVLTAKLNYYTLLTKAGGKVGEI